MCNFSTPGEPSKPPGIDFYRFHRYLLKRHARHPKAVSDWLKHSVQKLQDSVGKDRKPDWQSRLTVSLQLGDGASISPEGSLQSMQKQVVATETAQTHTESSTSMEILKEEEVVSESEIAQIWERAREQISREVSESPEILRETPVSETSQKRIFSLFFAFCILLFVHTKSFFASCQVFILVWFVIRNSEGIGAG